jgi:hypothetical protein
MGTPLVYNNTTMLLSNFNISIKKPGFIYANVPGNDF